MGIFSWLRQPKGHKLTDEDRERAGDLTATRWELKKKQMEREDELHALRAEKEKAMLEAQIRKYSGGEDDDKPAGDDMTSLMPFLMMMMQQHQAQPLSAGSVGGSALPPAEPVLKLSDEEIDSMLAQVPKMYLKMAKGMPNDAIRKLIEQKIGKIDDDTFNRAINKIRG